MNGKIARKIRKLVDYEVNAEENNQLEEISEGSRYFGVIDGVHGNHRIEERNVYSMANTSREHVLYKKLCQVYKTKQPIEIYNQLIEDLQEMK